MTHDKKWLVKSSDTITGPLEFNEVVQSIFSGDIHLLDEIKGPFERWRSIKDHSLFAAAIEKLKATTYARRENTITATIDLATRTQDLTKTQTLTGVEEWSQTPRIEDSDPGEEEITQVFVRSGGKSTHEKKMQPRAPQPVIPAPVPAGSRFWGAFLLSFLLLVMAGGAWLIWESGRQRPQAPVQTAEQLSDEAMRSLKVGDYQKALSNFILAANLAGSDPNIILEMAPLSVQFDGQFSHVEVMVENLLATSYKKDFMKRGKNVVGLTYSYRGRFKDALKAYDEALEVDSTYFPAQINRAFALLRLGDSAAAVSHMKAVILAHPSHPMAHFLYVRALFEHGRRSGEKAYFEEALSVSGQFDQRFSNFKQEVFFLKALARQKLLAPANDLELAVKTFLRVDAELTQLHVHDPHIDFQSFNWSDFANDCQGLRQGVGEYVSGLLDGFCLLKANRMIEAKKVFESLLPDHNNDGVLQSLYAAVLLRLDQVAQAKNALGYIGQLDDKQPLIETVLRGCLMGRDMACVDAIFKGKHSRHISLLYSHWGNSALQMMADSRQAKNSIDLGLQVSPQFAPLLKLKKEL